MLQVHISLPRGRSEKLSVSQSSSLPNAHMVKLHSLYFHNFGDGYQSINSFSPPDLHTDLFYITLW